MNTNENNKEKFSDDPEEQMRIENEILKLKLSAELGGQVEQFEEMPSELENLFLSNVLEFEHKHAQSEEQTIHKILGQPVFAKEDLLNDEQVSDALRSIEALMEEKSIVLDYAASYPDREKYRFITEEFFQHETSFFSMAGMMMCFSYEEFHPNHEVEIRRMAKEFIEHWFNRSFSEYSTELAYQLITDDARTFTREELLLKLRNIFSAYVRFEDSQYVIDEIKFDLNDETDTGFGFAEGGVKYNAILENGEVIHIGGPFKLYFQTQDRTWWDIFFFYWPGFEW